MNARARRTVAWLTATLVVWTALIVLIPPAPAPALSARGTVQRATLADIEREVMCPTCGTPLMVSQSPLADRERAFIQALIARGETKPQIERAMVRQFGPGILATPAAHGFDLAAYLVPLAVALLGLGAVSLAAVRWRRRGPAPPTSVPPVPAALGRRLDQDLSRYDL